MYHVTARGNHRQDIFFKHGDRQLLDEIMSDALAKTGARVHAYCWMTNHLHLLVQVADRTLGELMQRVGTRFARAIQRELRTTGHLFENRYHAVLVDVDSYFLELLRYIHLNPVRARIVTAAHQYRWSSHRVYLDKTHQAWVHTDFGLSLFSNDADRARQLYQAFVDEQVGGESPLTQVHPLERRVLGDDTFLQKLTVPTRYRFPATSLKTIASQVCAELGTDLITIRAPSHQPKYSRARALIASRAIDARAATLSEVARFLNRNVSSLSRAVARYCYRDSPL
jgi:REP element-mobilizing transposase RayT